MSPPLEVESISVKLSAKLLCRFGEGVEKPCTYLETIFGANHIWVCVVGLQDGEPIQGCILEEVGNM